MANDPRFECWPESDDDRSSTDSGFDEQFFWHFRDANGRLTFTGGESFDSRANAHRAIRGAAQSVVELVLGGDQTDLVEASIGDLEILDLDQRPE